MMLYVYYDERYPASWISDKASEQIIDYLCKYDFEVINASKLKSIMNKGVREKVVKDEVVVVFAQDIIPDTVVDNPSSPTANSLLRSFLNAGHTVVWLGDVPLYYVGSAGKKKINVGDAGKQRVLNLNPSVNHLATPRYARPTIYGMQLGLPCWRGQRPMRLDTPSQPPWVVPLASNPFDQTYHHAFLARYTRITNEISGFIRIYDMPLRELTDQLLNGILCSALRMTVNLPILLEALRLAKITSDKFDTLKSEIEKLICPKLDEILNKLESPPVKALKKDIEDLKSELSKLTNKVNEIEAKMGSYALKNSNTKETVQ